MWEVERVALDLDLDQTAILLVCVGVYRCAPCGRHFRGQPPFLRPDAIYTRRVVATAMHAVVADGMAVTRVVERMARDFWIRPSEAMIRAWCRQHAAGAGTMDDHREWVLQSFSGILCVDEVYQGQFALLLAVDPASPQGDRLIGYQLVHGDVEQKDVEEFLVRLREKGVAPDQVITDGSQLYPAVLAKVWPRAAQQLCLFHETRTMLKATLKVIDATRRAAPQPPEAIQRIGRRRRRHDPRAPHAEDRASRVAWVQQLVSEGMSRHEVARQTGHSRRTVRRWLMEDIVAAPALTGLAARRAQQRASALHLHGLGVAIWEIHRRTGHSRITLREWIRGPSSRHRDRSTLPPKPAPDRPPEGWRDWDEVRRVRQILAAMRYRICARRQALSTEEKTNLEVLFATPLGASLRVAHEYAQAWYAIWHEGVTRRSVEDAQARFVALQTDRGAAEFPGLKRHQSRLSDSRFAMLSHFLRNPSWESTNNGAERTGRQFRHLQASRFRLRTRRSLEDVLNLYSASQRVSQPPRVVRHCTRGRRPRDHGVEVAKAA